MHVETGDEQMGTHANGSSSDTPIFVGSSDGHVGIPTTEYATYLESQYQQPFEEFVASHKFRWTPEYEESMFRARLRDRHRDYPQFEERGLDVLSDPARRLVQLDADGVAVEVLFPDDQNFDTPPWLAGIAPHGLDARYAPELRLAGARAYNRWLAEFCAPSPQRLLGMTALGTLEDVDAAVAEVHRAAQAGLRSGIVLPCDYYLPLYHHPRYEKLWATCEELGLVVTVHSGDGGPSWYGEGSRAGAVYMAEVFFYSRRPLWCLIFGGVFDRYPRLKVAFTEQGSSWVPGTLQLLEGITDSDYFRWTEEDPLPLRPTEYFERQCFVGNSTMTRADIEQMDTQTIANVMWGEDFPHFEGMWPHTTARLRDLVHGVPESRVRALLGADLARAYNVDLEALRGLVDLIGPRPSALALGA
jgi:predicted TIM-barrel fold metal-dependent hydrolase